MRDPGEMVPIEFKTAAGRTLVISRSHLSDGKILLNYMDITATRKREEEIQEALKAVEHNDALLADATSAMTQGLLILRDNTSFFANDAFGRWSICRQSFARLDAIGPMPSITC